MTRTLLGLFFLLAAVPSSLARAPQGIVAPAGVRMTLAQLEVRVIDGVASTTIHQTWRNDGEGQAEATWILPLPAGAVADGFTMTV
ncbi:MAG: VIT domain-containing protein, partial [Planctomycetota bacterium]